MRRRADRVTSGARTRNSGELHTPVLFARDPLRLLHQQRAEALYPIIGEYRLVSDATKIKFATRNLVSNVPDAGTL